MAHPPAPGGLPCVPTPPPPLPCQGSADPAEHELKTLNVGGRSGGWSPGNGRKEVTLADLCQGTLYRFVGAGVLVPLGSPWSCG